MFLVYNSLSTVHVKQVAFVAFFGRGEGATVVFISTGNFNSKPIKSRSIGHEYTSQLKKSF